MKARSYRIRYRGGNAVCKKRRPRDEPDRNQQSAGLPGCMEREDSRAEVERAKPNPRGALARLASGCFPVAMAVFELIEAGAYRVYNDPAHLLAHLDELGLRVTHRYSAT